jgi:hypothetical protein
MNIIPRGIQESNITVERVVATKESIYVLMSEVRKKGWLINAIDSLFRRGEGNIETFRYIQCFDVD